MGSQFAGLRGAPVEPFATGWDNTAYLVDKQWTFRFPRRTIALPGVQHEIAVLPHLGPRLPLPIPIPEFVGRPSEAYPWPFWGGRLIPGTELAEAGLPDAERARAGADIGAFLRVLHDPGLVDLVGADLPGDPMRRGDATWRAGSAHRRLARLAEHGVWDPGSEPAPAVERLLAEGERLGPLSGTTTVCHGDLHIRHLLVDRVDANARACGVIDWGDVCVADPAIDLSLAYGAFTGPARTALLSAYGPVPAEREVTARVLAVDLCATLADQAASTGAPLLLAEALAGIERAVTG